MSDFLISSKRLSVETIHLTEGKNIQMGPGDLEKGKDTVVLFPHDEDLEPT